MLPLFDLMMKAQNGQATEAMARQFGLAQEQMREALTALMPAFSSGLKRTAANPYDFSTLMQAAASGDYAKYFEDMSKAFTPQGIADGNVILGQLFGSKDVSRAIAAQAAQFSGIGQDIFKQMMPIVANATVGGFFRQMAGQFQAAGDAISKGDTNGLFQQWMQATGYADKPKPQPQSPFHNPFIDAFQAMMNPAATKAQPQAAADPFAANPFMQMFAAMAQSATPAEAPAEKPSVAPEQANMASLFNQMFESGIEVQKTYQKNLDSIVGSYFAGLKPGEKSR
jgi:hypothetical protein